MTNLTDLTISESLAKLKTKDISPVELTQAYIDKMSENDKYNAYVTQTAEQALEGAKEAEKNITTGQTARLRGLHSGLKIYFAPKTYARQPARIL